MTNSDPIADHASTYLDVFAEFCRSRDVSAEQAVFLAHVERDGPDTGVLVGAGFDSDDELMEFLLSVITNIADKLGYSVQLVRPGLN